MGSIHSLIRGRIDSYFQVDTLGSLYKPVNFRAGRRPGEADWGEPKYTVRDLGFGISGSYEETAKPGYRSGGGGEPPLTRQLMAWQVDHPKWTTLSDKWTAIRGPLSGGETNTTPCVKQLRVKRPE